MADEAAVENLPVNRFFCHKCSREITGVLPDYTCPNCQSGFIEALEGADPEPAEDSDSEIEVRPFEFFNEMLMSLNTPDDFRVRGTNRSGTRRISRANRIRQMAPLENIIQDFLVNISGVGFGTGSIGIGQRGGQVLFLGNPGDYAWGREGLDAIVTQLLNQMDTTGPPPLAKEKIQEIPQVVITQEQVDTNLQCSVCWEDFKVEEQVRKLPCEHVYHENCIVPWLELHGTCPICRKTLSDDPQADDSESASNPVGTSLAALFRVANESVQNAASGGSSSTGLNTSGSASNSSRASSTDASTSNTNNTNDSTTNNTTGNSSSSSARPDFNMDIDFD